MTVSEQTTGNQPQKAAAKKAKKSAKKTTGVKAADSSKTSSSSGKSDVPKEAVRPDGSVRKQPKVKPGYVPPEEVPAYQVPVKRTKAKPEGVKEAKITQEAQKSQKVVQEAPKVAQSSKSDKKVAQKAPQAKKGEPKPATKLAAPKKGANETQGKGGVSKSEQEIEAEKRRFKLEKKKRLMEKKRQASIEPAVAEVPKASGKSEGKKQSSKNVPPSKTKGLSEAEIKKIQKLRILRRRIREIAIIQKRFDRGERLYEDQIRKMEGRDTYLKRFNFAKLYT